MDSKALKIVKKGKRISIQKDPEDVLNITEWGDADRDNALREILSMLREQKERLNR